MPSSGSPPPPIDLSSYMRSMHQHTKRQVEVASQSSHWRAEGSQPVMAPMPNGYSSEMSSSDSRRREVQS